MAIKKWFIVLFFLPVFGFAQDEGTRFTQRLTWIGDEYTRRYEVVIEREEGGRFQEWRREFTTALFVEVSLLPGKYRFRVIPYNFLDQPRDPSRWMNIEVLAAFFPVLDDTPEFFLLDTGTGTALYEMRVSGRNLVPGAEIFLRASGGEGVPEERVPEERIVPVKIQTGEGGTNVLLFFEEEQLAAGDYELVVINPGGLQTSRGGIGFPPPERAAQTDRNTGFKAEMYLSAAWMPSFTIYDEENLFGQDMSALGAVARFGAVWVKWHYFNPGLELTVSYNFFDGEQVHFPDFGLNLIALRWLSVDKTALTFRLGAGYSAHFHANIGISFLLFVTDHLHLETGLDYAYWFIYPPSSCFRPWLGVGWRF